MIYGESWRRKTPADDAEMFGGLMKLRLVKKKMTLTVDVPPKPHELCHSVVCHIRE